MTRTTLQALVVLVCALVAAPPAAAAQPPAKVPRIGHLSLATREGFDPRNIEAFRQALRDLGYVEGQTIGIEWRFAEGRPERLPDLAAELVRLNVDVIVAVATPGVQAARQAAGKIPIVMVAVVDPVGAGLVASVGRPGGSITGLSLLSTELMGKRLELLKEAVPGVSRVAVLWHPANRSNVLQLGEAKVAAPTLGVRLQPLEVRAPQDLESAFQAARRERAGALITLDDPLLVSHRTRIVALAAKSRLPAMYGLTMFAEVGGLMSYGPNLPDMWRRAAAYVDKILKGAKPADLPVEQPMRFELVINLRTAKALGLTIPRSLLSVADEVIQ